MPVYTYRAAGEPDCACCRGGFEADHTMAERLTECPLCGAPVKRVFTSFGISSGFGNQKPDYTRAKEKGFTVLENQGEGQFKSI